MLLASAAWDARVPRRITAAAIAAALQGVFYWLILHDAIEPTTLRSLTPLQVTVFQVRRSRPARAPALRPQPRPTQPTTRQRETPSPAAAQPITLPAPGRPRLGASVDWQQALQREVRSRELAPPPGKLEFGFPRRAAAPATAPRFGWDYARTHRVQPLPEGGVLINLSDRCAVVLYVLPIPVCKIGHIPTDGGLFDHMRDGRGDGPGALP